MVQESIYLMSDDFNSRTIFVAIPTMEDYEYAPTIKSLFDNAKYPERVFVGSPIYVVSEEQITDPDYEKFWELNFDYPKDNYKSEFYIHEEHYGVGKGRLNALNFFNNEHYYFQVDSHMRFEKDWDFHLINEYEECKDYFGERVLLGQYAPGYVTSVIDGEVALGKVAELKYPIWIYDDFRVNSFPVGWDYTYHIISSSEDFIHSDKYIAGKFLPAVKHCAHNLFTESDPWVTRYAMNLSPEVVFWGEEIFQASLAWMRGYEFCWSKNNYVFHKYAGLKSVDVEEDVSVKSSPNLDLEGNITRDYFGIVDKEKKYKYVKYTDKIDLLEIEAEVVDGIKDYLDGRFGYVPRSFEGFLIWSGINLKNKQTKDAFYVPPLNPVFKKIRSPDTNATTP